MKYVNFGQTGMVVSRMTLGGMNFGVDLDCEQTARVVDESLDRGINFIDTAESYGRKRKSEEFLGKALKGKRDHVYLTTKVYRKRARNKLAQRNSSQNIIESLEGSLRLLQTDYLDLYQLHHPDPQTPLEETLSTLERLIAQGKVLHVGVCNHYAWQLSYMIAAAGRRSWHPAVSLQHCYNILDRAVEQETVPLVQRFGLATMAYSPLCGGVLTGKYKHDQPAPEGTRGARVSALDPFLDDPRTFEIVDRLKPIAERNKVSLPQLAVLWVLSKPHVTTAILGGSKLEHFRLMLDVADKDLPAEDVEEIDKLSEDRIYRKFRNQPNAAGAPTSPLW